ncbi:MAG TPA: long-chain fatty acid--CoA ligase [Ignavibacteria bacterium]|nr:long-chain fatty acid--CoA ligase [Ignavibacteria bacterium]
MKKTLTNYLISNIETFGADVEEFFTKHDDEYIPLTYKELLNQVYSLIVFFKECGLQKGDKVGIISESRTEWVAVDFACMFSGLISIPVYTSVSDHQIEYILENSDSKICFVSNTLLLDKVINIKKHYNISEKPGLLEEVIIFNEIDISKYDRNEVKKYTDIVNLPADISFEKKRDMIKKMSEDIKEDDLLTIIYTSGTTGIPKGVMLTHLNFYSNVTACQQVLPIGESDVFLSYLPYSHIYERTAGYYLPLFCGAKIYYAQNIDTIAKQLIEVSPTFVMTVPRLLDKIYNKLMKSSEDMESGFKRTLFRWAVDLAHNKEISSDSIKHKIANALVYKKIREKTGGKIRYFVSGGGALNKKIGEFFFRIGVEVLEGYGMTESSPVISVNIPSKNKYGTVGKALPGVNIKLTGENEILVSGELVMKGYYKDPEITNETIVNGWLHTGDIGEIDNEGYLRITDRKKSLIKTSGGKYVSPTQIEDIISSLGYIENIMVIGNERMYITAVIVPNKEELINFAQKNKITGIAYSELLKNKELNKLVQKDINIAQKDLAHFERVRHFIFIEESFSIENGELTPTMKIKRKFVEEKYKNEIENLYLKI